MSHASTSSRYFLLNFRRQHTQNLGIRWQRLLVVAFGLFIAPILQAQSLTQDYQYDPLGRLVHVSTDGQTDAVYCYDKAGNREAVMMNGEVSSDCPSLQPLPPPSGLSYGSHPGNGWTIRWNKVNGAVYYLISTRIEGILRVDGKLGTTATNDPRATPNWIQACDEVQCSERAYF